MSPSDDGKISDTKCAVDDLLRPQRLDSNDHAGGDVGIGARADHGSEM